MGEEGPAEATALDVVVVVVVMTVRGADVEEGGETQVVRTYHVRILVGLFGVYASYVPIVTPSVAGIAREQKPEKRICNAESTKYNVELHRLALRPTSRWYYGPHYRNLIPWRVAQPKRPQMSW